MDDIYQNLTKGLYKITPTNQQGTFEIDPSQIGSGEMVSEIQQNVGNLQNGKTKFDNSEEGFILGADKGLAKFFIGDTSNYLNWDGTTLTISGAFTASSGTIGGFSIGADYMRDAANSFGLASTVTAGDDIRFWAGDTFINRATAPFRVTEAGVVTASNITITGGSVVTSILSGTVAQANLNLANRGWTQSSSFSVTDADTIAWGAGTFTSADGTTYSISAGNTGNMTLKTYIYLDIAVSTTVYQITTTASTAVGVGKVLIAIAQNATSEATYTVLQGQGGQNIDAANIVAGSITANEIAASTITAGKLSVITLSAISADLGSITAGTITGITITGGTLQTATSGQRIRLVSASAVSPTQLANSLGLIDTSSNLILHFGSNNTIIQAINCFSDVSALAIQGNSGVALTHNLVSMNIVEATSTSHTLLLDNAGSGMSLKVTSGRVLVAVQPYTVGETIAAPNTLFLCTGTATNNAISQITQDSSAQLFGVNWFAQTFQTSANAAFILGGTLYLGHGGSLSLTYHIFLYVTSGGAPSTGGSSLVDLSISAATIGSDGAVSFTFASPVAVSPSTTYALVLAYGGGDGTHYITLFYKGSNVYANGSYYSSTNSGGSWSADTNKDLYFTLNEAYTAGRVYKASSLSNGENYNNFVGFQVSGSTSLGGAAGVAYGGVVPGFSGLTQGSTYYMSDTGGAISTTAGSYTRELGIAVSTTELLVALPLGSVPTVPISSYVGAVTTKSHTMAVAASEIDDDTVFTCNFQPTVIQIYFQLTGADSGLTTVKSTGSVTYNQTTLTSTQWILNNSSSTNLSTATIDSSQALAGDSVNGVQVAISITATTPTTFTIRAAFKRGGSGGTPTATGIFYAIAYR